MSAARRRRGRALSLAIAVLYTDREMGLASRSPEAEADTGERRLGYDDERDPTVACASAVSPCVITGAPGDGRGRLPGAGAGAKCYFFDITGAASGWHVLQLVIPRLLLSRTTSGVGGGGASM